MASVSVVVWRPPNAHRSGKETGRENEKQQRIKVPNLGDLEQKREKM